MFRQFIVVLALSAAVFAENPDDKNLEDEAKTTVTNEDATLPPKPNDNQNQFKARIFGGPTSRNTDMSIVRSEPSSSGSMSIVRQESSGPVDQGTLYSYSNPQTSLQSSQPSQYFSLQSNSQPTQYFSSLQSNSQPTQHFSGLQSSSKPTQYFSFQSNPQPTQYFSSLQSNSQPSQFFGSLQSNSQPSQFFGSLQSNSQPSQFFGSLQSNSQPSQFSSNSQLGSLYGQDLSDDSYLPSDQSSKYSNQFSQYSQEVPSPYVSSSYSFYKPVPYWSNSQSYDPYLSRYSSQGQDYSSFPFSNLLNVIQKQFSTNSYPNSLSGFGQYQKTPTQGYQQTYKSYGQAGVCK